MRPDDLERRLRERLWSRSGSATRRSPHTSRIGSDADHVLMLYDFDRADRIGEFWSYPETRAFAELLIDCEEDRTPRAVLVGMLREPER
jgi:hypothetical protein